MSAAPTLRLTTVASELTAPTAISSSPHVPGVLFVTEQRGMLLELSPQSGSRRVILNIASKLVEQRMSYDERGLLGIAFHPTDSSRLFLYYSSNRAPSKAGMDHVAVLSEFKYDVKGSGLVEANSERVIFTDDEPHRVHNSGNLLFLADGSLLLSRGDGGLQHDPYNRAQNPDVLWGKILKIDVDNGTASIYTTGVRNIWGMSLMNDAIIVAHVGQDSWESLFVITEAGKNLGWRVYEGSHIHNADDPKPSSVLQPVFEYDHEVGDAIIGGYIDTSSNLYICGDWRGKIFLLQPSENSSWTLLREQTLTDKHVRCFGRGPKGTVYVVTTGVNGLKGKTAAIHALSIG